MVTPRPRLTLRAPLAHAAIAACSIAACDDAPTTPTVDGAVVDGAVIDGAAQPGDVARVDAVVAGDVVSPGVDAAAPRRPGLLLRGFAAVPRAHATEAVVTSDAVYLATSLDGVKSFRLGPDGTPTLAWEHPDAERLAIPTMVPRCTTLARHAGTATIYCAAADADGLAWYHARDPDHLSLDPRGRLRVYGVGVRAMRVVGDALLLAGPRGLERAAIAGDGTPGERATLLRGDLVDVDGDAETLVVLDRARGLVQARLAGDAVVEVGAAAPLDGPPLDLSVRGGRAYVALGSQGVAVFDLSDAGPRLRQRWTPPAVVTAIDGDGDRVVAGATTGVYAFALEPAGARAVGFMASRYGSLDVRLDAGRALAVDWSELASLAVDFDGESRELEVSLGYLVDPSGGVAFEVRNPGDRALTVAVRAYAMTCLTCASELRRVPIAAGGRVEVAFTAAELAALRDGRGQVSLDVAALEVSEYRMGLVENVTLLASPGAAAGAAAPPLGAVGPPPLGAMFPRMVASAGVAAPSTLPLPSRDTRVVFITADCALQWTELEDLAWRARQPGASSLPTAVILFVQPNDANLDPWWGPPFLTMLGAGNLTFANISAYADASARPAGAPPPSSDQLFTLGFGASRIVGPDTNADYLVDAAGRVSNFERIYRGAHPLAARRIP